MAKHYALKRENRHVDAKSGADTKPDAKPTALDLGARKSPERRASDRGSSGQLLWSFAVAVCLILAALLQWTAPKNALLEQDRAPAQIHFENGNSSPNGS
jgi:hypothetical protein